METYDLVTLIRDEVGAAWTRAKILEAMNRAQNEILGVDNDISRVKPDPFLTTVDATYSYAATSSLFDSSAGTKGSAVGDVRSVRRVYSYQTTLDIFGFSGLDPGSAKPNKIEYGAGSDKITARVDVVQSIKADSSDCVIKWWEGNNPGATTIVWRAETYLWPAQLTAETIALDIPEDFQDTLLLLATIKRLERREFGNNAESMALYDKELRRFRQKYSQVASQDGPPQCKPLIC